MKPRTFTSKDMLSYFRALGLAKQVVRHVEVFAREHGFSVLRLETGIHQSEAIALYEQFGFAQIPPFGDYKPDPLSRWYEKKI